MTMKSEPLYHSELFSFIFDLLWETTFLFSCLELFVDTGYVQGTEKMIMRGVFVEASSRRGGEGFWNGVWQDALFWSDTRRTRKL